MATTGKDVSRLISCSMRTPNRRELLSYMQQVEQEDQLISHARSWIADGWELSGQPQAEQVAAALFMEARFQDGCVADGESDASFPIRLREVARNIINLVHADPVYVAAGALLKQVEQESTEISLGAGVLLTQLRIALNSD